VPPRHLELQARVQHLEVPLINFGYGPFLQAQEDYHILCLLGCDLHLPDVLIVEFEDPQLLIGLIGNLQGVRKYHQVARMVLSLYL
jgi:hypothetical protein